MLAPSFAGVIGISCRAFGNKVETPRNIVSNLFLFLGSCERNPQVEEIKEQECDTEELSSPSLPLAFQNTRETLKDLKAQKLMEMPVQKLTQEDSGRLAAKLLASSTYPSVPCMWGRAWRLLGKHRPSLGRGCDTVRKLFRKLCLPGCVVWIRVKRSKRQRDWFCGSVAMTVI